MSSSSKYTTKLKAEFAAFYPLNGVKASMAHFGINKSQVINLAKRIGVTVNPEVTAKNKGERMKGITTSTPEVDAIIKRDYLTVPIKRLTANIGRSQTFVRTRMKQLGLVVPTEIIQQRKDDSRIKKGNVPINKGKKLPTDIYEKVKHTFFKKGHKFNIETEIGQVVVRKRKNRPDPPYMFIKLGHKKWELYHRHLWEQANGQIPDGHVIAFKDGNSLNCTIENLQLLTMAENSIRNSGSTKLTDAYVVNTLAGKERSNKAFKAEISKHSDLISLKRHQLLLNRKIKNHAPKRTQEPQ